MGFKEVDDVLLLLLTLIFCGCDGLLIGETGRVGGDASLESGILLSIASKDLADIKNKSTEKG